MPGRSRANAYAGEIDTSWQKWTKCKVCERRICVNNYEDHKVRIPRRRGVVVCPWCGDNLVQLYLIVYELIAGPTKVRKLQKKASKLLGIPIPD